MSQGNRLPIQDFQVSVQETGFDNDMQLALPDERRQLDIQVNRDSQVNIRSLSFDPYVTSYVCLLAPRFEEHLIIGDLSDWLSIWMKDICVSFGWQLPFIDIKPEYLHWVISVSINMPSIQFMKIIRRESSSKILDEFPRVKVKNMSKDFWAPWHFVRVGLAPYPQSTIRKILEEIRMQQGLR